MKKIATGILFLTAGLVLVSAACAQQAEKAEDKAANAKREIKTMNAEVSNYLGAAGIGVSDLDRSFDFYTRVIGMKKIFALKLPHMDEIILGFEGRRGAGLVIMHYTDGSNPNYKKNPVKLVLYVKDPKESIERIRKDGLEIIRDAEPVPELGNAVVGFARDPDGYLLEILQAQPAAK